MLYLTKFNLLPSSIEDYIIFHKKNIYNNLYPLRIFPEKELEKVTFEPITIFYGGNGTGKTTLLNIIGNKIKATKKNINNKGELFNTYVDYISDYELIEKDLKEIKMISSDDVFDYLLDLRAINDNVNRRKTLLEEEYYNNKYDNEFEATITQYEKLKNKVDSNRLTVSKYIRTRLTNNNMIEQSNGESALEFWEREITDNSLYLLDEPENSLSAENQLKLAKFILDSARFYNCQFIISTHSPFLLSILGAKIYDLDDDKVKTKKWTELKNVKIYYDFFMEHKNEFKGE